MPNVETLVWVLGGALAVVSTLSGVIWTMLRNESAQQAGQLSLKADTTRLHEVEQRFAQELTEVKENSEKLVNKLEQRHDREMQQMAERLGDQIRVTEANILAQIRIMFESLKKQ